MDQRPKCKSKKHKILRRNNRGQILMTLNLTMVPNYDKNRHNTVCISHKQGHSLP